MVTPEMLAVLVAIGVALLVIAAEALHLRRIRRLARLAFGPSERPSPWVRAVPALRAAAAGVLAWGLLTLLYVEPKTYDAAGRPPLEEGEMRHVLLVLDVSPSMRLQDAGPTGEQSRMQRARDVMESFFRRVPLEQYRMSVVAVYNGAKPVVEDTSDLEVVRNILGDLPMHFAFKSGKTRVFDGLEEAARIAKPWNPGSATVVLVSDGDTVPAQGMPRMPDSVANVVVVGVGDPNTGTFIDGRQSRQEVSTLRQIAVRLGGTFHNGNERHLSSSLVGDLSASGDDGVLEQLSLREYALLGCGAGALLLALLPLLLQWLGTGWRPGTHHRTQARGLAMKRTLTTTLTILFLSAGVHAQSFEEIIAEFEAQGTVIEFGAPPEAAPEADEEEPAADNSKLIAKLKKLTFDRRPSAILAAWSTPEPDPDEEDAEGEDAEAEAETSEDATDAAEPLPDPATPPADADAEADAEASTDEATTETPDEELTEEEKAAKEKAKAEAAAAKAKAEAEAKAAAEKAAAEALEKEMEHFQRLVTLGRWDEVREYLGGLDEEPAEAGYTQLLKSLVKGPPRPKSPFANFAEKNVYAPEDVTGLAGAAPMELEAEHLTNLAKIFSQCVEGGSLVEDCLSHLRETLAADAPSPPRAQWARIAIESGFPVEAGEFLPTLDEALADDDRPALNLLARHFLAVNAQDGEVEDLERAWTATQAVLAAGDVEEDQEKEALARAVAIAPRLTEELGQVWLDESFSARPRRGMEILSVIGANSAGGLVTQAKMVEDRFKNLELQTTAVDALLDTAPELGAEWAGALTLLATNWLREAEHTYEHDTSVSRGPSMGRDMYGNMFFYGVSNSRKGNVPEPITTDRMLDIRPSDTWLGFVHSALRPKCEMVIAQLLLKVGEEAEAFPHIEMIAETHPERAEELVEEFLRVWTSKNDPNQASRRTSYVYFYGFEQRANAIPLTRSKQERNLAELAEWIARLRSLPIDGVDEELLARAFMTAHSRAEVYRLETIERVFGAMDALEPKTLAELVQAMRGNLVGVWRQPATQEEQKTRRRQKDIQTEVLRGYDVARAVVERGLRAHPGDWALSLALASVVHDENNFNSEIALSSEFSSRRHEAFALFRQAAADYAAAVGDIAPGDQTDKVFSTWFYASLGACDLGAVQPEMVLATAEIAAIREAIESLPGEAAERHRELFANALFTRMSSANPGVKFRYVSNGLEIAGDHERAAEAREVHDYYKDLITEIRFETRVDGADRVGHGEPFGLQVDIRHTREIEREAGGFSKYLTNQNDQGYSWNYGRPTENYRDKFEEGVREALSEHFEVQSVTFNHPDTHSRADEEYGWRVTPYAYILMKARSPEIDRVPSLKLDLDFLDTSGYVVLPVASSPVPIDAQAGEPRPYRDLRVTQTLDERQADKGRLLLEVKATALGLVPALEDILDLAPEGFDLVSVEDQGVSVSEFDKQSGDVVVLSERAWDVEFQAEEQLDALPSEFAFGVPRGDVAETVHHRYVDADLESVAAVVPRVHSYGERDVTPLLAWGGAIVVLVVVGAFLLVRTRRGRGVVAPVGAYRVPDTVSPFTVLGLLRAIDAHNGVSSGERAELQAQIADLEQHYFAVEAGGGESPDLRAIAERWVDRVG